MLALIGYDRLAGAGALLFTASVFGDPAGYDLTNGGRLPLLVPVLCFCLLLVVPRRRNPDVRGLAWLAVTAALALAASRTDDTIAAVVVLALLVVVPSAFAMIRTDPRPAIACVLSAAYFGFRIAQDPGGPGGLGLLFLAATPIVLTIVVATTRHAQARIL